MLRKKVVPKKTTNPKNEFNLHIEEVTPKVILEKGKCKAIVHSVRLSAGATINLGDFESSRFDVGITLSALDSNATTEELAEVGWDFVRNELGAKIKSVRSKNQG